MNPQSKQLRDRTWLFAKAREKSATQDRADLKKQLARDTEDWLRRGNQIEQVPGFEQDASHSPAVVPGDE